MAAGSSSSSGSGVPPGFRFHPTDEELLHYYLKKKISFEKFDLEVIREVDLNKMEPWELQERCKIGSTPQNEWYFFSHKDRKYPTGSRTNRATNAGFWKATGRDKCIRNSYKKIGMRKTLVFYRGRAPHGQKTDWIMHEYRLEEGDSDGQGSEDGWVVCRVFKKKHFFKIGGEGSSSTGQSNSEAHLNLTGASDMHRTHYLLHNNEQQHYMDQSSNVYRPDLALHYLPSHHHYSPHIQVQNLLPDPRQPQPSYDLSVLPVESQSMVRAYNATGLDVGVGGNDGSMQQVGDNRDPNNWTMLVEAPRLSPGEQQMEGRFSGVASRSVNQIDHIPNPRGEMDLWGYGK